MSVSEPELSELLAFAEETARAAGEEIRARATLSPRHAPRLKGRRDPVTEADLAAERLIVERLRAQFPDDAIFAEEETRDSDLGGRVWYVDPLDGTVNFSQSLPFYAVSLALYDGAVPLVGVVHAPKLGETFTAARGLGAKLDGEPLRVSEKSTLIESVLATGFAYGRETLADDNVGHFADFVLRVRGMRRAGSAALDLAYVAAGRLDGYWEPHLNPFDVAAGALLVQEAGGVLSDMSGGDDWLHGGSIVASGAGLRDEILATLAAGHVEPEAGP